MDRMSTNYRGSVSCRLDVFSSASYSSSCSVSTEFLCFALFIPNFPLNE
jgi:hypothetical protein